MALDAVILAAGASRRYGACKLLAPWQGEPLLMQAINAVVEHCDSLTLITGAWHQDIAAALKTCPADLRLRYCPEWQQGIGRSLAFAAGDLPASHDLLVLLGDQPLIGSADILGLINAWRRDPARVCCAQYAGSRGVPALFPAAFKPGLQLLDGDNGAKALLADACLYPMPHAVIDIDTPADLERLSTYTPNRASAC